MTIQSSVQPPCLTGYESINRYWDRRNQTWAAKILPGELYVTTHSNEIITTTLGSCVSACIRDKKIGVGGMNHFMLPVVGNLGSREWLAVAARYGAYAMEYLINEILKNGGMRDDLEVKLVGGGKVISAMTDIGHLNIEFALDYLATENLVVTAQDLGGPYPRKVMYYPNSGRMRVKKLRDLHNETLLQREQSYLHELEIQPDSGEVELF